MDVLQEADLDRHAAEFREQGFTVIPRVLPDALRLRAIDVLEEIFESERDIAEQRQWATDMFRVSYMLLQKHAVFRELVMLPFMRGLMTRLLGRYFLLSNANGYTTKPFGVDQPLHIDQWESVPGMAVYVNATLALDAFTTENGATRVVPGSHDRQFPGRTKAAQHETETIRLEAPAGSLVAFSGGLWHASSANINGLPRRSVHCYYCRPWCMPQWDLPRSLTPDVVQSLSQEEMAMYGYYNQPKTYDITSREVRYPPKHAKFKKSDLAE